MVNSKKLIKVNKLAEKLKNFIIKFYDEKKYNKCLALINCTASIYYKINQKYYDSFLEDYLNKISLKLIKSDVISYIADRNTVLFYDDFGLDTRGLALIYLKALCELGYQVIYITKISAINRQPQMHECVSGKNITFEYYIDKSSYVEQIKFLDGLILKYKPKCAFMYVNPNNVVGTCVFNKYRGKFERFYINLTDHAFWLGANSSDFFIEFRDYGAIISKEYRNINSQKLIKNPFYPLINYKIEFKGFPFKTGKNKIIFSGGALYKTFGENNKYYKIVDSLLCSCCDLIFLYAGHGNSKKILDLKKKYPKRVWLINEREDLFAILKNVDLYLSTYPITGGLMTQYAVAAKVLPLTLRNDEDSSGMLLNQNRAKIYYNSDKELIDDALKLLNDKEYMESRKLLLNNQLINEEQFTENLHLIIEEKRSKFSIDFYEINTKEFRLSYLERFSYFKNVPLSVATRNNLSLIDICPFLMFIGVVQKIIFKKTLK